VSSWFKIDPPGETAEEEDTAVGGGHDRRRRPEPRRWSERRRIPLEGGEPRLTGDGVLPISGVKRENSQGSQIASPQLTVQIGSRSGARPSM
jgi:hypothetical protein